jgi:cysteine desulfurase
VALAIGGLYRRGRTNRNFFTRTRTIPERVYLDHAATSPLRPEAKAAMVAGFALWANPSSPHAEGRRAKAALEDARERVKQALGWSGEVIFTSGASEALWIALNRAKVSRRIVSAVEHDAVFRAAPDAAVFSGNEAIGAKTLLAVQHVNSETGTINPVGDMAATLSEAGALLLSDCAQSAGKLALPHADMLVVSAHKFGGPIGIGALLVRDFAMLEPSGGHERGYRQGTENLPGALGMAAALEAGGMDSWATDEGARQDFRQAIWAAGEAIAVGPQCSHIFAVAHPTMSAQALLIRLDAMGFAVSAGSACSSGTLKKSRVLDAFGVPDDVAARTIRVSLGWSTTQEELERFAAAWASLC